MQRRQGSHQPGGVLQVVRGQAGLTATPVLYGHRGAPLEVPENTLGSFRRAFDVGAHAIETDAYMTADGHVVLSHDPTGERTAGVPRAIAATSLSQLRTWNAGWGFVDRDGGRPFRGALARGEQAPRIPTLGEALATFPDALFNVDAKVHGRAMARAIVDVIRRAGAQERVRIASFSARTLGFVRALGYEGPVGLGQADVAAMRLLPRTMLRRLGIPRGDAAQIPRRSGPIALDTTDVIRKFHDLGVRVDYWVIDTEAEARELLDLGADGVVSDDPRAVAPAFAGERNPSVSPASERP